MRSLEKKAVWSSAVSKAFREGSKHRCKGIWGIEEPTKKLKKLKVGNCLTVGGYDLTAGKTFQCWLALHGFCDLGP